MRTKTILTQKMFAWRMVSGYLAPAEESLCSCWLFERTLNFLGSEVGLGNHVNPEVQNTSEAWITFWILDKRKRMSEEPSKSMTLDQYAALNNLFSTELAKCGREWLEKTLKRFPIITHLKRQTGSCSCATSFWITQKSGWQFQLCCKTEAWISWNNWQKNHCCYPQFIIIKKKSFEKHTISRDAFKTCFVVVLCHISKYMFLQTSTDNARTTLYFNILPVKTTKYLCYKLFSVSFVII